MSRKPWSKTLEKAKENSSCTPNPYTQCFHTLDIKQHKTVCFFVQQDPRLHLNTMGDNPVARDPTEHATDLQQVSSHCISHNVFGVDLMAIENNVLVVLLLSATTNSVLRENRVKRSARCGIGRSSLTIV